MGTELKENTVSGGIKVVLIRRICIIIVFCISFVCLSGVCANAEKAEILSVDIPNRYGNPNDVLDILVYTNEHVSKIVVDDGISQMLGELTKKLPTGELLWNVSLYLDTANSDGKKELRVAAFSDTASDIQDEVSTYYYVIPSETTSETENRQNVDYGLNLISNDMYYPLVAAQYDEIGNHKSYSFVRFSLDTAETYAAIDVDSIWRDFQDTICSTVRSSENTFITYRDDENLLLRDIEIYPLSYHATGISKSWKKIDLENGNLSDISSNACLFLLDHHASTIIDLVASNPRESISFTYIQGTNKTNNSISALYPYYYVHPPVLVDKDDYEMTDNGYVTYSFPNTLSTGLYLVNRSLVYFIQENEEIDEKGAAILSTQKAHSTAAAQYASNFIHPTTYFIEGTVLYEAVPIDDIRAANDWENLTPSGRIGILPETYSSEYPFLYNYKIMENTIYYQYEFAVSGGRSIYCYLKWEDISFIYDENYSMSVYNRLKDQNHYAEKMTAWQANEIVWVYPSDSKTTNGNGVFESFMAINCTEAIIYSTHFDESSLTVEVLSSKHTDHIDIYNPDNEFLFRLQERIYNENTDKYVWEVDLSSFDTIQSIVAIPGNIGGLNENAAKSIEVNITTPQIIGYSHMDEFQFSTTKVQASFSSVPVQYKGYGKTVSAEQIILHAWPNIGAPSCSDLARDTILYTYEQVVDIYGNHWCNVVLLGDDVPSGYILEQFFQLLTTSEAMALDLQSEKIADATFFFPELFSGYGVTNVDKVNYRASPDQDGSIITRIDSDVVIRVLDITSDNDTGWYYCESGGVQGYIRQDILHLLSIEEYQSRNPAPSYFINGGIVTPRGE